MGLIACLKKKQQSTDSYFLVVSVAFITIKAVSFHVKASLSFLFIIYWIIYPKLPSLIVHIIEIRPINLFHKNLITEPEGLKKMVHKMERDLKSLIKTI